MPPRSGTSCSPHYPGGDIRHLSSAISSGESAPNAARRGLSTAIDSCPADASYLMGKNRTWSVQSSGVLHSTIRIKSSNATLTGSHCGLTITPGQGSPALMRV